MPNQREDTRRAPSSKSTNAVALTPDTGADAERGRQAAAPWRIPWNGWKDIFLRTYQQANENRLLSVAARVVFYGLLALLPAITALVSSYALFAKGSTITDHLSFLAGVLPGGTFDIVKDQVDRVLSKGDIKLGAAFIFSFLLAVRSANGGVKAQIDALNVAYKEKEKRGFFKLNAVSLLFTFGGLFAALVAIGAIIALPLILSAISLNSITEAIFRFGRWPLLIPLILSGLAVLYRYAASRRSPQWRWINVGSTVVTATWRMGSALLSFYLSTLSIVRALQSV
jgi:membrane protein